MAYMKSLTVHLLELLCHDLHEVTDRSVSNGKFDLFPRTFPPSKSAAALITLRWTFVALMS